MKNLIKAAHAIALLALFCAPAGAQQGHPLSGSWSGDRDVNGRDSRLLVVLDLQRDQSITGYVIENRTRIPLKSVTLDPADWSVNIVVEGQDRAGNPLNYQVDARIENLGSWNAREIVGTWSGGSGSGDFRLRLN